MLALSLLTDKSGGLPRICDEYTSNMSEKRKIKNSRPVKAESFKCYISTNSESKYIVSPFEIVLSGEVWNIDRISHTKPSVIFTDSTPFFFGNIAGMNSRMMQKDSVPRIKVYELFLYVGGLIVSSYIFFIQRPVPVSFYCDF